MDGVSMVGVSMVGMHWNARTNETSIQFPHKFKFFRVAFWF